MVSGPWSVVRGQWSVVSGPWSVVRGQWSVVSGPWSVVRCQWSVVSGHNGLLPTDNGLLTTELCGLINHLPASASSTVASSINITGMSSRIG